MNSTVREIYLAGGCFWGIEEYFSRIAGVVDVESGYANGTVDNPSYQQVCTNTTGHAETVRVRYDPAQVSLATIMDQYFKVIDPTILNRQGNDRGTQYRTGGCYTDEADLPVLRSVFDEVAAGLDKPVVTELAPLACFWPAEEYHQEYLTTNPGGYCHVDFSSLASVRTKG